MIGHPPKSPLFPNTPLFRPFKHHSGRTPARMTPPTPTCPRVALIGVSGYARIYLALAKAAQERGEMDLCAAVIINPAEEATVEDRKSTRLNSSHQIISYAVF